MTRKVMPKARPSPILRSLDQPAYDWIAVHVFQLLNMLAVGMNVEVIIPGLPEWPLWPLHCDRKLQGLNRLRQNYFFRFAYQQMNMLRHDNMTEDEEVIAFPHRFEGTLEETSHAGNAKMLLPPVTTEGDKVEVA
jgi:hypothetical protein